MDQDKYIALLYKRQQGSLDAMEKILLDKWLAAAEINRTIATKIEEDWQLIEDYEPPIEYDIAQAYDLLQQRIATDEMPRKTTAKVVTMQPSSNWVSWAAAVALVLIGIGSLFFTQQGTTTDVLVNTIQADKLEVIQLIDGTKVWLKANSHFQYPDTFKDTRTVQLEGEAFFEVAKNPSMPFIVQTEQAIIQVLGTVFNVRAIPNAVQTEVLVTEGKVELRNKDLQTQKIQLVANEKGVLQHQSNHISKAQAINKNELAWRTQVLLFKGTPLKEVVSHLERLFEIEIQIANAAIENCLFTGRYSELNLEEILKDIQREFKLTTERKGSVILLAGKGCS